MDMFIVLFSNRPALIKQHFSGTNKTGCLVEFERRVTELKICLAAASKSLIHTYIKVLILCLTFTSLSYSELDISYLQLNIEVQ